MTTRPPRWGGRWWPVHQKDAAPRTGEPAAPERHTSGSTRSFVFRPTTAMASWEQWTAEGGTTWHGGQSSASRMTIRMIQEGDEALILNGDPRRALVGIARVVRAAYPAPAPHEPSRLAIDLQPIARIAPVIMLSRLRTDPHLNDCAMLRIPTPELVRLSPDQRRVLRRLGVA